MLGRLSEVTQKLRNVSFGWSSTTSDANTESDTDSSTSNSTEHYSQDQDDEEILDSSQSASATTDSTFSSVPRLLPPGPAQRQRISGEEDPKTEDSQPSICISISSSNSNTRSTISSTLPKYNNTKTCYPPKKSFIGRESQLIILRDTLMSCSGSGSGTATGTGFGSGKSSIADRIVVLTGPEGIGKSELARKYADFHSLQYDFIIWIDAQNFRSLADSFLKLRDKFKLHCSRDTSENSAATRKHQHPSYSEVKWIAEEVYAFLLNPLVSDRANPNSDQNRSQSQTPGFGLFIFDDASNITATPNPNEFSIKDFLPTASSHRYRDHQHRAVFLITSRNHEEEWTMISKVPADNIIKVDKLAIAESDKFLFNELRLNHHHKSRAGVIESIQVLSNQLNGFPIALSLVASSIHLGGGSGGWSTDIQAKLKQYIKQLPSIQEDWKFKDRPSGEIILNELILNSVWSTNFDGTSNQGLGDKAWKLLSILSYLPTHDISLQSVVSIFNRVSANNNATINFNTSGLTLTSISPSADQADDEIVDLFRLLEMHSLISIELESDENGKDLPVIRIHRLVQKCTRDWVEGKSSDPAEKYSSLFGIADYLIQDSQEAITTYNHHNNAPFLIHEYLKTKNWPEGSLNLSLLLFGSQTGLRIKFAAALSEEDRWILFQILLDVKFHFGEHPLEEEFLNLLYVGLLYFRKWFPANSVFHDIPQSQQLKSNKSTRKPVNDKLEESFLSVVKSYIYDSMSCVKPNSNAKITSRNYSKLAQQFSFNIVELILKDSGSLSSKIRIKVSAFIRSDFESKSGVRLDKIRMMFGHLWEYRESMKPPEEYLGIVKREHENFSTQSPEQLENYWSEECPIPMQKMLDILYSAPSDKEWSKEDLLADFVKEGCLNILVEHLTFIVSVNQPKKYCDGLNQIFKLLTVLAYDGNAASVMTQTENLMKALKLCTKLDATDDGVSPLKLPDWSGRYGCLVVWFAIFSKSTDFSANDHDASGRKIRTQQWSILSVENDMRQLHSILKDASSRTYTDFIEDIRTYWNHGNHKKIMETFLKSHAASSESVAYEIARELIQIEKLTVKNYEPNPHRSSSSANRPISDSDAECADQLPNQAPRTKTFKMRITRPKNTGPISPKPIPTQQPESLMRRLMYTAYYGNPLKNGTLAERNPAEQNVYVRLYENSPDKSRILHGALHQGNEAFGHAGVQCTAMAAVACAFSSVLPPAEWLGSTINDILTLGDSFYGQQDAGRVQPWAGGHMNCMDITGVVQIPCNNETIPIQIHAKEEDSITGYFDKYDGVGANKTIKRLKSVITTFVGSEESHALVTGGSITVSLIKKDGHLYLFDSHSTGPDGLHGHWDGAASVIQFEISQVSRKVSVLLHRNMQPKMNDYTEHDMTFTITPLTLTEL